MNHKGNAVPSDDGRDEFVRFVGFKITAGHADVSSTFFRVADPSAGTTGLYIDTDTGMGLFKASGDFLRHRCDRA